MANDNNSAPVADLVAMVPDRDQEGKIRVTENGEHRQQFVTICPLWRAQSGTGNLSGTLQSEPIAWKNPNVPRRLLVQFRSRN